MRLVISFLHVPALALFGYVSGTDPSGEWTASSWEQTARVHYYTGDLQGWPLLICKGGFADRPYQKVATNGGFAGAVGEILSRSYKSI
jgi:hypothetical protein